MDILRGYLGPNLKRLLQRYWDEQAVVPKSGKLFGRPFRTERGVTKGGPVSLKIFNIVVDAVVREVLLEVCGPQEEHKGLGWVASEHNIFFYANDGRIVGRKPILVQRILAVVVRML